MLGNEARHGCGVPRKALEAGAPKRRSEAVPERAQAAVSVAGFVEVAGIGRLGERGKTLAPVPPCAGRGQSFTSRRRRRWQGRSNALPGERLRTRMPPRPEDAAGVGCDEDRA